LDVRSGFAVEAEGFFEVKSYYGWFGELEHEKAQRTHRDEAGRFLSLGFAEFGMARIDSF